jgi:hypothetical protein
MTTENDLETDEFDTGNFIDEFGERDGIFFFLFAKQYFGKNLNEKEKMTINSLSEFELKLYEKRFMNEVKPILWY